MTGLKIKCIIIVSTCSVILYGYCVQRADSYILCCVCYIYFVSVWCVREGTLRTTVTADSSVFQSSGRRRLVGVRNVCVFTYIHITHIYTMYEQRQGRALPSQFANN